MPKEKSVGAVIYTRPKEEGKLLYLLLHYPATSKTTESYWDLPKGHVERGEKELGTARREVEEETGIKGLVFARGFRQTINYFFQVKKSTVYKTVVFYLAETPGRHVLLSDEHDGYQWLPYPECVKAVKYQNAKDVLANAHRFLSQTKSKQQRNSKQKTPSKRGVS